MNEAVAEAVETVGAEESAPQAVDTPDIRPVDDWRVLVLTFVVVSGMYSLWRI